MPLGVKNQQPNTPTPPWRTKLAMAYPSLLSAAGQGMGALQAIALLIYIRLGENNPGATEYKTSTDAYFFFFSYATIPGAMIGLGLVYSMWLRHKWSTEKHYYAALLGVPALSALASIGAFAYYTTYKGSPADHLTVLLIAAGGVLSAFGHIMAAKLAASGKAEWLSAITVATNFLGFACLLATNGSVQGLATGQFIGSLIYVLALSWFINRNPLHFVDSAPATVSEVCSLLARAVCGYGLVLAWQSAIVRLPEGEGTLFNVIARIANGLVAVLVNAPLPKLINVHQIKEQLLWKYLALIILGATALNVMVICGHFVIPTPYTYSVAIALSWYAAISLNAITQRYIAAVADSLSIYYVAIVALAFIVLTTVLANQTFFDLTWAYGLVVSAEVLACIAITIGSKRLMPSLMWGGVLACGVLINILVFVGGQAVLT